MPHDPNWFYSSLAQCAAAVVGLLGAVLATRLQQQLSTVRTTYEEVAKHIRTFRSEMTSRIIELDDYATFADARIAEIEAALAQGNATLTVQRDIRLWSGSSSGSPWHLKIDDSVLAGYKEYRALVDPTLAHLQLHQNARTVADVDESIPTLVTLQQTLPPQLQGAVASLRNAVKVVDEHNFAHLTAASIRIPTTVATILAWLCAFGLLVPLGFLSAYEPLSKRWLLIAFGLGVAAIPAYIFLELVRIKHLKRVDAGGAA